MTLQSTLTARATTPRARRTAPTPTPNGGPKPAPQDAKLLLDSPPAAVPVVAAPGAVENRSPNSVTDAAAALEGGIVAAYEAALGAPACELPPEPDYTAHKASWAVWAGWRDRREREPARSK